jgi:hypothetical protein
MGTLLVCLMIVSHLIGENILTGGAFRAYGLYSTGVAFYLRSACWNTASAWRPLPFKPFYSIAHFMPFLDTRGIIDQYSKMSVQTLIGLLHAYYYLLL